MNAPDYDAGHEQEEQLVLALKRVVTGTADRDDALNLAAALGLSKHFNQLDRRHDDEFKNAANQ